MVTKLSDLGKKVLAQMSDNNVPRIALCSTVHS